MYQHKKCEKFVESKKFDQNSFQLKVVCRLESDDESFSINVKVS